MSNIMKFFETEEGRIVSYVEHELCNSIALIGGTAANLIREINNGLTNPQEIVKCLEDIKRFAKRNNEAADYLYKQFKERYDKQL